MRPLAKKTASVYTASCKKYTRVNVTIAGIGKDVKKAGEVVSDTAEDCKGGCDD